MSLVSLLFGNSQMDLLELVVSESKFGGFF